MESREPSDFRRTKHFDDDVMPDRMRFLTDEMIEQIIMRGHDYREEGGPDKFRRKKNFEGVLGVLVIARDQPVLVTGWTEIESFSEAMASERWTTEQLRKIRAFQNEEHKMPTGEWMQKRTK